jgi:hypothetical protein
MILGKLRHRWEYNITTDHKGNKMYVDYIQLINDRIIYHTVYLQLTVAS